MAVQYDMGGPSQVAIGISTMNISTPILAASFENRHWCLISQFYGTYIIIHVYCAAQAYFAVFHCLFPTTSNLK